MAWTTMSTPSLPLGGSHIGGTLASSKAVPLLLEPQLASLDMINSCNVFYSARQGTLDFLKGKGQGKSCTCIPIKLQKVPTTTTSML